MTAGDRLRAAEAGAAAPDRAGRERPQAVRDVGAARHAVVPWVGPHHHALPHGAPDSRSSTPPRIRRASIAKPTTTNPARRARRREAQERRRTARAPGRGPSGRRRTQHQGHASHYRPHVPPARQAHEPQPVDGVVGRRLSTARAAARCGARNMPPARTRPAARMASTGWNPNRFTLTPLAPGPLPKTSSIAASAQASPSGSSTARRSREASKSIFGGGDQEQDAAIAVPCTNSSAVIVSRIGSRSATSSSGRCRTAASAPAAASDRRRAPAPAPERGAPTRTRRRRQHRATASRAVELADAAHRERAASSQRCPGGTGAARRAAGRRAASRARSSMSAVGAHDVAADL